MRIFEFKVSLVVKKVERGGRCITYKVPCWEKVRESTFRVCGTELESWAPVQGKAKKKTDQGKLHLLFCVFLSHHSGFLIILVE